MDRDDEIERDSDDEYELQSVDVDDVIDSSAPLSSTIADSESEDDEEVGDLDRLTID